MIQMPDEIKGSVWFVPRTGETIGIVLLESNKHCHAKIGVGKGICKDTDSKIIRAMGAEFDCCLAKRLICPTLNGGEDEKAKMGRLESQ